MIKIYRKFKNLFNASLLDNDMPYGMNTALRALTDFPCCLSIPAWQQHGIYIEPAYSSPDFKKAAEYGSMLVFSDRIKEEWKKHSNIPCYVAGLILARYWEKMGWKQAPDAEGTIFFASHSTTGTLSDYDVNSVHDVLSHLDKKYFPITVSLHPYDVGVLHLDKVYRNLGYRVVSAADGVNSSFFPRNLFENLSHCKYACSNDIGTFILYSLSLKIPFFLIGNPPELTFNDSPDFSDGKILLTDINEEIKKVYDLFDTGPVTSISDKQMEWFKRETGEKERLSIEELRQVLLRHCLPITAKKFVEHVKIGLTHI